MRNYTLLSLCLLLTTLVSAQETATLVRDILPGAQGGQPQNLFQYGDNVLFTAESATDGRGLWISDGTEAGTSLVADINFDPAVGAGDSDPSLFTEYNGLVYFRARSAESGSELFVTDGTTDGTRLFADLQPGAGDGAPTELIVFKDRLYFTADDGANGSELWVTDGTEDGTELFADVNPGAGAGNPLSKTIVGDHLVFTATDGTNGSEPWITDGTTAGTSILADVNPDGDSQPGLYHTYDDNRVFFRADNGTSGSELFLGTINTREVTLFADLGPGGEGSNPQNIFRLNRNIFWTATMGGVESELVYAPVDDPSTVQKLPINADGPDNIRNIVTLVDDELVGFIGESDNSGMAQEIYLLDGLFGFPALDTLSALTPLETTGAEDLFWTGTDLYYTYETAATGRELAGVDVVVFDLPLEIDEINDGPAGAGVGEITLVGNTLFFAADNGATGSELYRITASTGYITAQTQDGDIVNRRDTLDFGNITLGELDSITVEFVNTGTNPTRFVAGGGSTDTEGSSLEFRNIPDNEILKVDPDNGYVSYLITPQNEGIFIDSVTALFYTGAGPSSVTFYVTGNVVLAAGEVEVSEGGEIVADGDTLRFTDVPVGTDSTRTLIIRTTGQIDVDVTSISLMDSTVFTFVAPDSLLAVGDSSEIVITYSPTEEGTQTDVLTIVTATGEFVVNLTGSSVTTSVVDRGIPAEAIYPNPTPGVVTIQLTRGLTNADYRVYDLAGKVVLNGAWPDGLARHDVDLSTLRSGVYQVEVQSGQKRLTASVVRR